MASPVLGIDLGTTNTVVAVCGRDGVSVLRDTENETLIPSIVSFMPTGDVLVGKLARERRLIDAPNTVFSTKRLIGRPFRTPEVRRAADRSPYQLAESINGGVEVRIRSDRHSLPEISAFVLRRARAVAEEALQRSCTHVVLTVPASFNELQRTATRDAGRIAGLHVLRILNEPTAAALAYGFGARTDRRVAVYDLGGGTFDLSILDLSGEVIEVVATAGDSYLGGDDIDSLIADRMVAAFLAEHRLDLSDDPQGYERLRVAAEWLKVQLSSTDRAHVRVEQAAFGPKGVQLDLQFSLTRAELDALVEPLVKRTFDICESAMRACNLRPTQVDEVILVGSQTMAPKVRSMVADYFGREPLTSVNPSHVVAEGAAVLGYALTGGSPNMSPPVQSRTRPVTQSPYSTLVPPAPSTPPPAAPSAPSPATISSLPPASEPPPRTPSERPRRATLPPPALPPSDPPPVYPGFDDDEPTQIADRLRAPAAPRPAPMATFDEDEPTTLSPRSPSPLPPPQQQPAPPVVAPQPPAAPRPSAPPAPGQPLAAVSLRRSSPPPPLTVPPPAPSAAAARHASAPRPAPVPSIPGVSALASSLAPPRASAAPAPADAKSESITNTLRGLSAPPPATPPPAREPSPAPDAPKSEPITNTLRGVSSPANAPVTPTPAPASPVRATPAPAAPPVVATPAASKPAAVAPAASKPAAAPAPSKPAASKPVRAAEPVSPSLPPPKTVELPTRERRSSDPAPAPLLLDVTPHTLAVETAGGYCEALIERNAPIPTEQTRRFTTSQDNQASVRMRICQGEERRVEENQVLGTIELSELRPAVRGAVKIEVTFVIDADGTLSVRARDDATGKGQRISINLLGGLHEEDVTRMWKKQRTVKVSG